MQSPPRTPLTALRARRLGALVLLAAGLAALQGCASFRVDKAAQTASGFASQLLCDDVFITGRDPQAVIDERIRPLPGMSLVNWAMSYRVDRERREAEVRIAGGFASRARLREGHGCTALPAGEPDFEPAAGRDEPIAAAELPAATLGPATTARLRDVLAQAIDDPERSRRHRTKALVVLQDGRLVGEHYASGYGAATPVLGFSMSKSLTQALVGILVRQGRLSLDQPAPVPQWQSPGDPRQAITIDQLLRQTTGLDSRQDNSGFDRSSQVMYSVRDKAAAFASDPLRAAPGTQWAYSDANYMLLSRIVRNAVGGDAEAVRRFARRELFAPLGMRQASIDLDATGTPIGSSHGIASARDWARFGQLYLDDGVAGGRRLLPEGWVRRAATPTLDTGYGAGFWTNRKPGNVPCWGVPWGLPRAPADAFFARGFMGQFTVVVPSLRLVVVRSSVSHQRGDDIEETDRIVGDVIAALEVPR